MYPRSGRELRVRLVSLHHIALMLSRPGPLPTFGNWSFEVKWDGVRAMVSTVDGMRVRSRRGWNMTSRVPELEDLPPGLVLDGELVSFNDDGLPWFPSVCDRVLHGDSSIPRP